VKAALNRKGLYVNDKERSIADFIDQYGHLPQAHVVRDIYALWEHWDEGCPDLDSLRQRMAALIALAEALDCSFSPGREDGKLKRSEVNDNPERHRT